MRTIYNVTYTQLVTSAAHPEGLLSNMGEYPKFFDSVNYGNNPERTFEVAEAEYHAAESAMLLDTNPVRVMQVITLDRADGQRIYKRKKGDFPVWPEPQPEPEPVEEPAE